MFSRSFADAHLTENILEDLPQNLASLGCILPIATKEKCEEEIIGRSGINFGKEIRNKNMMKREMEHMARVMLKYSGLSPSHPL